MIPDFESHSIIFRICNKYKCQAKRVITINSFLRDVIYEWSLSLHNYGCNGRGKVPPLCNVVHDMWVCKERVRVRQVRCELLVFEPLGWVYKELEWVCKQLQGLVHRLVQVRVQLKCSWWRLKWQKSEKKKIIILTSLVMSVISYYYHRKPP